MAFSTIAVISIGEMGLGIAQLLMAHRYRVLTYAADRSEATQTRAWTAGIELMRSLGELVDQSDCVLSIVPPRDALHTAERVVKAVSASRRRQTPLYYLDLNATSPGTAIETARLFEGVSSQAVLIGGGIIGGVPYPLQHDKNSQENGNASSTDPPWHCPSLIVSGPHRLPDQRVSQILNIRHVSENIGAATGIKMCYAALTKGFVALSIQSFTTAHRLGVLYELRGLLEQYNPSTLRLAEKGLVTMPPKAYRWVREMEEIGETMAGSGFERDLVSQVYRTVAEDTELGKEKPDQRVRGQTVEDVVELISRGLQAKKARGRLM
ncbi:hypothetical protein T310_2392 [Rasamsonia emersonii CBS 393.64]|uniref:6-phosphogluconate dehydrogenase C-terminal domain-like protein n=1 Tax=Rasamsonia emersonii (strain ATCC 16479 / CBS 393.64 / IMI 116815) TaxID=1408163 RepID=A0A0F4Z0Z9_RASE3|nr:hypothetical protein T310_2392 [Rasamsonia emersonii CBS 393.64]KKA23553.1 hypothetical protein T310_2392 [Rasamsonia emersonii CBS 393.64]